MMHDRRRGAWFGGLFEVTDRKLYVDARLTSQIHSAVLPARAEAGERAHRGGSDQRTATPRERSPHLSRANCLLTRGDTG